jgi:hypothetical protein
VVRWAEKRTRLRNEKLVFFEEITLPPVGTDKERAHENGKRTGERPIAGFDPAQRGPAR